LFFRNQSSITYFSNVCEHDGIIVGFFILSNDIGHKKAYISYVFPTVVYLGEVLTTDTVLFYYFLVTSSYMTFARIPIPTPINPINPDWKKFDLFYIEKITMKIKKVLGRN